ncbi:aromatic ring-hydroxylating dioxygenase subunit alpha [Paenibacillus sp. EPM92]|uniref:aromatic ring-hydroxylating oxygenase subunit alpha n=1 Tax=Paenibacillus sp. EPM92 TaxID=1561195 RepID=UPI0019151D88|nr:aromatic ring-hydroxylating dioxygenase subunit alpha [Paenibacillus sp. EPM92]
MFPDEEISRVPRSVYTDQELYEIEMKEIFQGYVWNLVGHESEIPNPGDYKTSMVGNIPIIVVRNNKDDEINVLVNTCAHRSAEVERTNCGTAKHFQCLYHKWTYDLTGKMIGAPYKEDIPQGINEEELSLKKLNVQLYRGLIFASFKDDMIPLEEYLELITEGLDASTGNDKLIPIGSHKVMFNCNWKIYSENIYDGYHTGMLHAAFRILRMFAAGGVGLTNKHGSGQFSYKTLPIQDKTVLNDMSVFEKHADKSYIINIFPAGVISQQLDTIAFRYVIPRGIDKTEVHFNYFIRESDSEEQRKLRIEQASNVFGPEGIITLEDAVALESVQKSVVHDGLSVILKPSTEEIPIHAEVTVRGFWKKWRDMIKV